MNAVITSLQVTLPRSPYLGSVRDPDLCTSHGLMRGYPFVLIMRVHRFTVTRGGSCHGGVFFGNGGSCIAVASGWHKIVV